MDKRVKKIQVYLQQKYGVDAKYVGRETKSTGKGKVYCLEYEKDGVKSTETLTYMEYVAVLNN